MQSVESIIERIVAMSREEFLEAYPAPLLVNRKHVAGDLRPNPQARFSSTTGAKLSNTMFLVRPSFAGGAEEDETYELEFPRFVWVAGGAAHEAHETITIGRFIDSDITINDYTISADHAWFLIDNVEGSYFIVDRGSTNGTYVDGQRLRPHLIYGIDRGQELVLGRLVFTFIDAEYFYDGVTAERAAAPAQEPVPSTDADHA